MKLSWNLLRADCVLISNRCKGASLTTRSFSRIHRAVEPSSSRVSLCVPTCILSIAVCAADCRLPEVPARFGSRISSSTGIESSAGGPISPSARTSIKQLGWVARILSRLLSNPRPFTKVLRMLGTASRACDPIRQKIQAARLTSLELIFSRLRRGSHIV